MLSRKPIIQALVVAIGLVILTSTTRGTSPTLDGMYSLDSKASDDIEKAIDTAVANMGFVTRKFARGIFKKRHPAYSQVRISHDANEVVVALADGNPMRMPIDGSSAKWKREDGETLDIKGEWKVTRLVQTIDTFADDAKVKDTQRINNFSLGADGNALTLNVHFTAAGLDTPIKYRLVYRRIESK
jgi:hypothetical protein